uniref:Uncharacterized protein n=1 Tax=Rhizophora mucronata TaxID=61149 RepID=A0A2P2J360_RHIMU
MSWLMHTPSSHILQILIKSLWITLCLGRTRVWWIPVTG